MSITKLRGKSAALIHSDTNKLSQQTSTTSTSSSYIPPASLLKIEPFTPLLSARPRKSIQRSYSTLSTTNFKRENDHHQKYRNGRNLERNILHCQRSKSSLSTSTTSISQNNGICHINRTAKEQEKLPDRINCDRRGLTAIPIFENERNLRLLSLQHNLINVFHIPDDNTKPKNHHHIFEEIEEIKVPKTILQDNENLMKPPHPPTSQSPQRQNGIIITKKNSPSPTLTAPIPSSNTINPNQTGTNKGNLVKSTFVQKSIILHANHKYALKRSKSFMTNYSKQFNNIKRSLQKCSLNNGNNNLISFDNSTTRKSSNLELIENIVVEEKEREDENYGIENLQVKNTQPLEPYYGKLFYNLVFLDLYDNQIEKISNLDGLKCLTVLLLGKNRITDISGLISVKKTLKVLDLHGNRISSISNKINYLQELKSLNLAGNQIRQIYHNDFADLLHLKELNLKRNKIKKVHGFEHLTSLERLWLCHNDLQRVEDMSSIAKAVNLQEVTIENNPVSLAGDCVSFLVSYLPNLIMLSQMPVTEQVRRAAMAWRKSKELSDNNYSNLSSDVFNSIRREEIISNARTNWELLRSQQVSTMVVQSNNKNSKTEIDILPSPQSQSIVSAFDRKEKNPNHEIELEPIMNSAGPASALPKRNGTKIKITRIKPDDKVNQKNSSSNNGEEDFFRLPPILKPYINSNLSPSSEKTPSSGSSLGPNVDSSSSCYNSASDNEGGGGGGGGGDGGVVVKTDEGNENTNSIQLKIPQMNEQPPFEFEELLYYDEMDSSKQRQEFKEVQVIEDTTDSSSNISSNLYVMNELNMVTSAGTAIVENQGDGTTTNVTKKTTSLSKRKGNENNLNNDCHSSSSSQSDKNSNISVISLRTESEFSVNVLNSSEKSNNKGRGGANTNKRYMNGSLMRSQTVKHSSNSKITNMNLNSNSNSNGNSNTGAATTTTITATTTTANKTSKQMVEREREQGGDYLIEICGRYLNIYGFGALRYIDKQWNVQKANDVLTLNFSYVNFNNIATILNRVKLRFPNAENFVFRETNINCLGQLNALAELQGITSLVIDPEGNPIVNKPWRLYAVYRLSHWSLKTINGIEVTDSEIDLAQTEYHGLSDLVLWSLPESMLQPLLTRLRLGESCSASKLSAKEWLMKADQSLKIVVGKEALQWKKPSNTGGVGGVYLEESNSSSSSSSNNNNSIKERGRKHLSVMIENTCNAVEKLQKLETLWPNLLLDIVRNTLLDYSQMDVYLKNIMAEIMK